MDNINLYEKEGRSKQGRTPFFKRSLGTIVSLLLLILTGLAYSLVMWWGKDYDARIRDTQIEQQVAQDNFDRQAASEVHDLYLRLEDMKEHEELQGALEGMELVEKNILAGVVLSEHNYTNSDMERHIEISGDAENLNVLGQQLAQLRSIDTAHSVTLEKMGVSDTGFILFTVNITL